MNSLYRRPRSRQAAFRRTIHRLRSSRLRLRRSRKAYTPERTRASLAVRNSRRRPPTNPFTLRNSRRLAFARAVPLVALMILQPLIAVSRQSHLEPLRLQARDHARAAEVALALLRHAAHQVACPGRAVLEFARGRHPE